ncbi:MAG: prenyltransferase/squalene oxidase repeat-containing protein, partial [Anaerolineae bacterium]
MSRALRYTVAATAMAAALALTASPASAQQAAIDSGLGYLRSTQNADGSWGGTPTSLNTVLQTTATAARTLQLLGLTEPSLTTALGFLTAQTPDTVDGLAHQGEVLAASGVDVTALVASIKSAQQGDGGWGIDLEQAFPSAVVDTLAAVRALTVADALDPTATAAALGFLLGNQNPDGGWGILKDQPSQVFYTALALLALKEFQQAFDLSAPLTAGTQFLAAQQNPDGSFGGSAFETALAFQALVRYTLNSTSRSAVISFLTSTQLANGSWAEDAFSTALVLRALQD